MSETLARPDSSGSAAAGRGALRDADAYARELMDYVAASPSSYHAAAEAARRLDAVGFTAVDEASPHPACGEASSVESR